MVFVLVLVGILATTVCFLGVASIRNDKDFYKNLPKLPPIPYAGHKYPPPTPVPGCQCGCNDPENKPDKIQQILREELHHNDDQDGSEGHGEVRN